MGVDEQRPRGDDAQPTDPLAPQRMLANIRRQLFGAPIDPLRIGPYTIVRRLGAGAIGIVFEAENPRLHRRVALKLVAMASLGGADRAAMLREAQALARLEHPNVVTIYDAGIDTHGLWVAMELLLGRDLQQWLQRTPQLGEVLAVMRQLGDGLVAVHDAGLVHRDVKPSNAFVRDDGRVCLLDFGLAIASDETQVTLHDDATLGDAEPMTTGTHRAAIGTPAYMAPEQHRGERATAASDQYAFCVMLWEAVYGARPFTASARDALLVEKLRTELPSTPPVAGVPRSLHRALLRGLAAEPSARHLDMRALLQQLPTRAHRRARNGLALLGAGALAGSIAWVSAARATEQRCADAEHPRTWSEHQRTPVHERLGALPGSHAPWSRIDDGLTEYEHTLDHARSSTCTAAREHSISEELADRRFACINELRAELGSVVELLASAEPDVLAERADEVSRWLGELDDAEACVELQLDTPERLPSPPSVLAEPVDAVRERIRHVRAELRRGANDAALAQAQAVLRDAAEIPFAPLVPEAQLQLARVHRARREWPAADAMYSAAYFSAGALRHHDVAWQAAFEEGVVHATGNADAEQAAIWLEHARAVPQPVTAETEAALLALDAMAHEVAEDYAEAARLGLAGLARARELGHDDPLFLAMISIAATSMNGANRSEQARALAEEELAARVELLGAQHLSLAQPYHQLGIAAWELGDLEASHAAFEHSIAIEREHLPARAIDLAIGDFELGRRLLAEAEHARAWPVLDEAATIFSAQLPPEHPLTIFTIMTRGEAALELGDYEHAAEAFQRTRSSVEAVFGSGHSAMGAVMLCKGKLSLATGDPAEALAQLVQAQRLYPAGIGIDRDARFDNSVIALGIAEASWRLGERGDATFMQARAALASMQHETHPVGRRLAALARTWLATHAPERRR